MQYYLAFDIGGTTIKYGLINKDKKICQKGKVATDNNKESHILKMLLKVAGEMNTEYTLKGIGVSTAGVVDDQGTIAYAGPTIPNYKGTPIKKSLEDDLSLKANVLNDVDSALLGEKLMGCARGYSSIYCIALGTGIGGAFYRDGQLFEGAHGTANNIGWTLYDPADKTNYEQRASTLSLARSLKPLGLTPIEAFDLARRGHDKEKKIIDNWVLKVAEGIANVYLLFDPEIMIIGGAVSAQKDYLRNLLDEKLKVLLPPNLCRTRLKMAQLGNKAQLYGAIANFLE